MFKILKLLLFLFVVFIFCYFRLKPLFFQTVGYTYDQGRDFLKAAEIVLDKNPTFIGPTTGIQGLFHGAWYYYLLVIPFLLFGGAPIGFYYFNFFLHLVSFILFMYFIYRYFGFLTSLLVSLLIATSPYFIFTSIFVGNNIMVLPTFLAFLLINYFLINRNYKKVSRLTFLSGLTAGFLTEFELAFGLFLLPSYLMLILLIKNLRLLFISVKNSVFFFAGLTIPFIPRLLFELKNNFSQTKILFSYLKNPASQSPHTYSEVFQERMNLFYTYYRGLFPNDLTFIFVSIFLIFTAFFSLEKRLKNHPRPLSFFFSLVFFLFLFSTLLKNSFFWENYYEGIQYLYLFLLAIVFSIRLKTDSTLYKLLKYATLIILLITSINLILKNLTKKSESAGTLKALAQVVDYTQSNKKTSGSYCVKIYTPPVIPFTYNYLFLYRKISKNIPTPNSDWVDRKCWFIIEPDDNKERRAEWLDNNIPHKAKKVMEKSFQDIEVIQYRLD